MENNELEQVLLPQTAPPVLTPQQRRRRNAARLRQRRARAAFTMIEIMYVITILGILLNMAAPSWIKARNAARAQACSSNLKLIDQAKEQYALQNKLSGNAVITIADLTTTGVLRVNNGALLCPSGGHAYLAGQLGVKPVCPDAYPGHNCP